MHLIGYLYEDYHDARSLEHKVLERCFVSVFGVEIREPNFIAFCF
jgi:hypothetical protein